MRQAGRRVRVLSLPGRHPYVDACVPPGAITDGSPTLTPSPALRPAWIREHATEFDLVHLHFGFEHLDAAELSHWLAALRSGGLPLVYTAHDLRLPHAVDNAAHDVHLGLLMEAAAVVTTLTAGAAHEIERRWGRTPSVCPHPPVFDPTVPVARTSSGRTVAVHLKSLRRNVVEPDRVVATLVDAVESVGAVLRVDVHPDVVERFEVVVTRRLAAAGRLDLRVHDRFADDELRDYLASVDVSVLPYAFGTHSGWLEACRDVGTAVVAPSCGHFADQWAETEVYDRREDIGLCASSLREAVARALHGPPASPGDRAGRLALVRAVHRALYAELARAVAS